MIKFTSVLFCPRHRWHLQFIRSEFRGQLPKPYADGRNATKIIPTHMNDMNEEEPSRYVSIQTLGSSCSLFVAQFFLAQNFSIVEKICHAKSIQLELPCIVDLLKSIDSRGSVPVTRCTTSQQLNFCENIFSRDRILSLKKFALFQTVLYSCCDHCAKMG